MSLTTITVGSNSYNLVSFPSLWRNPANQGLGVIGPSDIELGMNDAVSEVVSPFTRQTQTQQWPGGDWWDAVVTWPPLSKSQAWALEAFLAECRGPANVFQLGDPRAAQPLSGSGSPTVSANTNSMAQVIPVVNWTTLPSLGDYMQIQYRLYRILNMTLVGGSNYNFEVWPSVREAIPSATAITYVGAQGLFRLSKGRRAIHSSPTRLTTISIQCEEAR